MNLTFPLLSHVLVLLRVATKRNKNENKVGTRTPSERKVRQKWEQSGTRMGIKWEQSGNKNPKVGQEWEQSGNKNPERDKIANKVGTKWEQWKQKETRMGTKWKQEPQSGTRMGTWDKNGNKVGQEPQSSTRMETKGNKVETKTLCSHFVPILVPLWCSCSHFPTLFPFPLPFWSHSCPTKWEQSGTRMAQSGTRMGTKWGTRTKWEQSNPKVGQEPQSGTRMETK